MSITGNLAGEMARQLDFTRPDGTGQVLRHVGGPRKCGAGWEIFYALEEQATPGAESNQLIRVTVEEL